MTSDLLRQISNPDTRFGKKRTITVLGHDSSYASKAQRENLVSQQWHDSIPPGSNKLDKCLKGQRSAQDDPHHSHAVFSLKLSY